MQKLINAVALFSGLTSLALIGSGAYVFLNKDALIKQAQEKVATAATEAIAGALPGMIDAAMPKMPEVTGGAIPSATGGISGPPIKLP